MEHNQYPKGCQLFVGREPILSRCMMYRNFSTNWFTVMSISYKSTSPAVKPNLSKAIWEASLVLYAFLTLS